MGPDEEGVRMTRRWWPLVAICLGTFMLLVDVTIVNVALPQIALGLHASFASLQWVVDGYALALASLLLGAGSWADLRGHRFVFVAGLAVFAASSAVCGLAPAVGVLVAARLVQGAGAAAMFGTTFALIAGSYTGRDRGRAFGVWGAVTGASAAVGPLLGGLLTEAVSWRWVFFVNLPISALAIVLAVRVLPSRRPTTRRRFDATGFAAFTVTAAALTWGLVRAGSEGWTAPSAWSLLLVGVIGLAGFVVVEKRSEHPLLDLGLLARRTFTGVTVAALLLNFSAFAALTYSAIWLQTVLALSPIEAGLTSLPLSVCSFAVGTLLGRRLDTVPPGVFIGGGLLLIGTGGLTAAALLHAGSGWPALLPGFVLVGLGVGLGNPGLASTAMDAATPDRRGMAAGTVNTARQIGFAFGIALLGTVFATGIAGQLAAAGVAGADHVAAELAAGQARTVLAGNGAAGLGAVVDVAFAHGLRLAFGVAGAVGVLGGVLALLLIRRGAATAPHPAAAAAPDAPTSEPSTPR